MINSWLQFTNEIGSLLVPEYSYEEIVVSGAIYNATSASEGHCMAAVRKSSVRSAQKERIKEEEREEEEE